MKNSPYKKWMIDRKFPNSKIYEDKGVLLVYRRRKFKIKLLDSNIYNKINYK